MRDYILTAPDEAIMQAALPDYYDSEEGTWTGPVIANATIWTARPTPGPDDETPGDPGQKQSGFHLILRANELPESAEQYLVEGAPDIEPVFAGGLLTTPSPALVEAKRRKRKRVDDTRDYRIALGFSWEGVPIDTRNESDFANIAGLVQMAAVLTQQGITDPVMGFRAADDQTRQFTPQEMTEIGVAAFQHKSAHFQAAWALKDSIDSAQDRAALDAIDIDQGWP